jgi:hypothetical protein
MLEKKGSMKVCQPTRFLFAVVAAVVFSGLSVYLSPVGVIQTPDLTHYPFPDTGLQVKLTNQAVTPNAILWAGLMSDMEPPSGSIRIVYKDSQRWPNGGYPERAEELRLQDELRQQIGVLLAQHKIGVPTMVDTDISSNIFVGCGAIKFTAVTGYYVFFRSANGQYGVINTRRHQLPVFIIFPW